MSTTNTQLNVEVKIAKKADDPECVRVSCGGDPLKYAYCTYRGSKEDAIMVLEECLGALRGMAAYLGPGREPDVQPDDGKKYA